MITNNKRKPFLPLFVGSNGFSYAFLDSCPPTKRSALIRLYFKLLNILNIFGSSKLSLYLCIIKQWYVRDAECLRLIAPC